MAMRTFYFRHVEGGGERLFGTGSAMAKEKKTVDVIRTGRLWFIEPIFVIEYYLVVIMKRRA